MKQEINPVALVGIIIVVVALLAVFGYKAMQPGSYTPSPGVSKASGGVPGAVQPSASQGSPATPAGNAPAVYYPSAPPGSIPGKPTGSRQ